MQGSSYFRENNCFASHLQNMGAIDPTPSGLFGVNRDVPVGNLVTVFALLMNL